MSHGSLPALLSPLRAEIPIWSLRPGSADAIRPSAPGMQLWNLIRSSNGLEMTACFVQELELAKALGFATRTPIRRRLRYLRSVPGLLLEVPLGRAPGCIKMRPTLRWATDPTRRGYWEHVIGKHRIPWCAERFGLGPDWILRALSRLRRHARASDLLADKLVAESLDAPCGVRIQDAGGGW